MPPCILNIQYGTKDSLNSKFKRRTLWFYKTKIFCKNNEQIQYVVQISLNSKKYLDLKLLILYSSITVSAENPNLA